MKKEKLQTKPLIYKKLRDYYRQLYINAMDNL